MTWSIPQVPCAKPPPPLKEHGARRVLAYCTHAVLSGPAIANIKNSVLDELVVTDTIPLTEEALATGRIRQVSLSAMLAETVRRINNEESISAMFEVL
jgi:ribose-phosphate pyrophosphokinase